MDTNQKMQKYAKLSAIILTIAYIVLLIPVLYIGRYNYHGADDFGFSAASHVAWEDTHSMLAVIKAAGETVVDRWHTWQGTFTTMFLMALEPGIYGDVFYHFVPFIMIGSMTASAMFLFYVLIVKIAGCEKSIWLSVSMLYLIYALECMINPNEGFYWYNGSTHYMIPHAMAMVLVGVLLLAITSKHRVLLCVIASVLSFLLGGSNYISALSTGVGLGLAILFLIIKKKIKDLWLVIIPFVTYIPSFIINVIAPGNSVRQAYTPNHPGPIKAVMLSFYYCIDQAFGEWLDWFTILFVMALIPFISVIIIKLRDRLSFKYPLFVVGMSYCFLSSMYAPTSYASGDLCGGRVSNIMFLTYLLLIVVNTTYLLGWLDNKTGIADKTMQLLNYSLLKAKYYVAFVIAILVVFAGLTAIKEENRFVTVSAIHSLVNGEAKTYGDEARARSASIESNTSSSILLPRYTVMPYLLYTDDIVPDATDWRNDAMSRYYRIDTIEAYSID